MHVFSFLMRLYSYIANIGGHLLVDSFLKISFDDSLKSIKERCRNKQVARKKTKIHLIETGKNTMTGGRLKRLKKYISDKTFNAAINSGFNPYTGEELKPGEAEQLQDQRNKRYKNDRKLGYIPHTGLLTSAFFMKSNR